MKSFFNRKKKAAEAAAVAAPPSQHQHQHQHHHSSNNEADDLAKEIRRLEEEMERQRLENEIKQMEAALMAQQQQQQQQAVAPPAAAGAPKPRVVRKVIKRVVKKADGTTQVPTNTTANNSKDPVPAATTAAATTPPPIRPAATSSETAAESESDASGASTVPPTTVHHRDVMATVSSHRSTATVPAALAMKDDPRFTKYWKMKMVGLPHGAIENAMARDNVDTAAVHMDWQQNYEEQQNSGSGGSRVTTATSTTTAATSTPSRSAAAPPAAAANNTNNDRPVHPLAAAFAKGGGSAMAPPPTVVEAVSTGHVATNNNARAAPLSSSSSSSSSAAADGGIPMKEDPRLIKYWKMKSMGLPDGAVMNAMVRDNVDHATKIMEFNWEHNLEVQLAGGAVASGATAPASSASRGAASTPSSAVTSGGSGTSGGGSPMKDDPRFVKYWKMKNMGLPDGAVMNAMVRDNVENATKIIGFNWEQNYEAQAGGSTSAPPAARPSAGGGNPLLAAIQGGASLKKTETDTTATSKPSGNPMLAAIQGGVKLKSSSNNGNAAPTAPRPTGNSIMDAIAGGVKLKSRSAATAPEPPAPKPSGNPLIAAIQAGVKLKSASERAPPKQQQHANPLVAALSGGVKLKPTQMATAPQPAAPSGNSLAAAAMLGRANLKKTNRGGQAAIPPAPKPAASNPLQEAMALRNSLKKSSRSREPSPERAATTAATTGQNPLTGVQLKSRSTTPAAAPSSSQQPDALQQAMAARNNLKSRSREPSPERPPAAQNQPFNPLAGVQLKSRAVPQPVALPHTAEPHALQQAMAARNNLKSRSREVSPERPPAAQNQPFNPVAGFQLKSRAVPEPVAPSQTTQADALQQAMAARNNLKSRSREPSPERPTAAQPINPLAGVQLKTRTAPQPVAPKTAEPDGLQQAMAARRNLKSHESAPERPASPAEPFNPVDGVQLKSRPAPSTVPFNTQSKPVAHVQLKSTRTPSDLSSSPAVPINLITTQQAKSETPSAMPSEDEQAQQLLAEIARVEAELEARMKLEKEIQEMEAMIAAAAAAETAQLQPKAVPKAKKVVKRKVVKKPKGAAENPAPVPPQSTEPSTYSITDMSTHHPDQEVEPIMETSALLSSQPEPTPVIETPVLKQIPFKPSEHGPTSVIDAPALKHVPSKPNEPKPAPVIEAPVLKQVAPVQKEADIGSKPVPAWAARRRAHVSPPAPAPAPPVQQMDSQSAVVPTKSPAQPTVPDSAPESALEPEMQSVPEPEPEPKPEPEPAPTSSNDAGAVPMKQDARFVKYWKMKSVGLPDCAILNAMMRDNVDNASFALGLNWEYNYESQVAAGGAANTTAPTKYREQATPSVMATSTESPVSGDVVEPPKKAPIIVDTGGTPMKDDARFAKYWKMKNMGLPDGAVLNAMIRDEFALDGMELDWDLNYEAQLGALAEAAQEGYPEGEYYGEEYYDENLGYYDEDGYFYYYENYDENYQEAEVPAAPAAPVSHGDLLSAVANAAKGRAKRLEETGGELIMQEFEPEVEAKQSGPQQLSFSLTEMVTKKAREREARLEAGGEKKIRVIKEKEEYKKDFKTICLEAAALGRLTRLNEHMIEAVAQEKTPEEEWKSQGLLAIQWRSNHMAVINEAAKAGAAFKLPEKIVSNCPDLEEDWDWEDEDALTPRMQKLLDLTYEVGTGQQKVDNLVMGFKEENVGAESLLIKPMVFYQNIEDVKLPRPAPPKIDVEKHKKKLEERAKLSKRPLSNISGDVAEKAWERRTRLDRPGSLPRVKNICECPYCINPTPYQTFAYKEKAKHAKTEAQMKEEAEKERLKLRELRRKKREAVMAARLAENEKELKERQERNRAKQATTPARVPRPRPPRAQPGAAEGTTQAAVPSQTQLTVSAPSPAGKPRVTAESRRLMRQARKQQQDQNPAGSPAASGPVRPAPGPGQPGPGAPRPAAGPARLAPGQPRPATGPSRPGRPAPPKPAVAPPEAAPALQSRRPVRAARPVQATMPQPRATTGPTPAVGAAPSRTVARPVAKAAAATPASNMTTTVTKNGNVVKTTVARKGAIQTPKPVPATHQTTVTVTKEKKGLFGGFGGKKTVTRQVVKK